MENGPEGRSGPVRFAWGLALTPLGGLLGVVVFLTIDQYWLWHPVPAAPPSIEARPPLGNELLAVIGLALLTSLFSWPVTLVTLPLVRGRFPRRSWRAFCVVAASGLAVGLFAPGLVAASIDALRHGVKSVGVPIDAVWSTAGGVCGFLIAIPYFLLTNPRRPPVPSAEP